MSGWERSRYIPWDRIPTKTGLPTNQFDLDNTKERIYRELQKEAIEKNNNNNNTQGNEQQQRQQSIDTSSIITETSSSIRELSGSTSSTKDTITSPTNDDVPMKVIVPYSHMDLLRQGAFGATLGCITGSLFGFMDSMKHLNESTVLQKTSNAAKMKYLIQGTTRSGLVFGTFFTTFQCIKYATRILLKDPGDAVEISTAAPITLGALYSQPIYRPAMPYAVMLIGMDCFSLYMRKTS